MSRLGACASGVAVALLLPVLGCPVAAAADESSGGCVEKPARQLLVLTVPQVSSFTFRLGSHTYTTNRRGQVRVPGVVCADVDHALAPKDLQLETDSRTRALFDGWYGEEALGRASGNGVVYAAFREQSRIQLGLVDLDGNRVPRSAIGTITIQGSTGAVVEVPPGTDSVVLDSSRVVHFSNGFVSKDILWSVQSADMNGNTVVNRGEVRFLPRQSPLVTLRLGLYPLRLRVRDAILHLRMGGSVAIKAPDGSVVRVPVRRHDGADAGLVGRGTYTLRASGGLIAIGFDQPVAMSRPQDAELTVVSFVDLAIFGSTALGIAVGLVLVGRRLRRRRPRPLPVPVAVPAGGAR